MLRLRARDAGKFRADDRYLYSAAFSEFVECLSAFDEYSTTEEHPWDLRVIALGRILKASRRKAASEKHGLVAGKGRKFRTRLGKIYLDMYRTARVGLFGGKCRTTRQHKGRT
jgi:hypothetical protein